MCSCLSAVYVVFLNNSFWWWNKESIWNWDRNPLYYTLNIVKNPVEFFSTPQPWSIFSAICYDERQAPIVRGMHLVIFSRSYHWKSVNLLFHVFRQEITVSVVGQFRMRGEKSIIFKRRILELISVPLKRRHITVLKTYMSFLFSPFCTPQWVIIINKENMGPTSES